MASKLELAGFFRGQGVVKGNARLLVSTRVCPGPYRPHILQPTVGNKNIANESESAGCQRNMKRGQREQDEYKLRLLK